MVGIAFFIGLVLAGCSSPGPVSQTSPLSSGGMRPPVVATVTSPGAATATIEGGVRPCAGIPAPNEPHYAAAMVTLLKGKTSLEPRGGGVVQTVFPTPVVATVSVGTNQGYRFIVPAGDYVVLAHFAAGNAQPWVEVTVRAGESAQKDVPNMCL